MKETHTKLHAWPMIKTAKAYGFKPESSPNLGTYMTHPAGHTLTIQENGDFSFTNANGESGACASKHGDSFKLDSIEYGLIVLNMILVERVGMPARTA